MKILHTGISIGLRSIPPSAGLARLSRKPSKTIIGHNVRCQPKYHITVIQDTDLEKEITDYRGMK